MIKYDSSHPDYEPSWDQWSLRVDADGAPVPPSQESDADYFARPPMPFIYGGTVDGLTKKMITDHSDYIPQISTSEQRLADKQRVKEIMFLQAQSISGRDKMRTAFEKGYALEVRPDVFAALSEEEKLFAVCDRPSKSVWLSRDLDPLRPGVRSVAHELVHLILIDINKMAWGDTHSFNSGMSDEEDHECAARVGGVLSVAELYFDGPNDHPRRWKPHGISHAFDCDTECFRQAILKAGRHLQQGNVGEFCFEMFCAAQADRDYMKSYQRGVMQSFMNWAPKLPNGTPEDQARFENHMTHFMQYDNAQQVPIESTIRECGIYYMQGRNVPLARPVLHPENEEIYQKMCAVMAERATQCAHAPKTQIAKNSIRSVSERLLEIAEIKPPTTALPIQNIVPEKTFVPSWMPANIGPLTPATPQQISPI